MRLKFFAIPAVAPDMCEVAPNPAEVAFRAVTERSSP